MKHGLEQIIEAAAASGLLGFHLANFSHSLSKLLLQRQWRECQLQTPCFTDVEMLLGNSGRPSNLVFVAKTLVKQFTEKLWIQVTPRAWLRERKGRDQVYLSGSNRRAH